MNQYRSEIINNEVHWAEGLYVAKFISVTKFVLKYLIFESLFKDLYMKIITFLVEINPVAQILQKMTGS